MNGVVVRRHAARASERRDSTLLPAVLHGTSNFHDGISRRYQHELNRDKDQHVVKKGSMKKRSGPWISSSSWLETKQMFREPFHDRFRQCESSNTTT